ncbi:hypothetical protein HXX76_009671 [Chlamydomonas incerta]|uniref:PDZ domain-containing protein n=1 Tax=Chlamydomonas incerta TaxID=51695 RepID=A0A835VZY4_CHLIN|nr:hypothetical protein HXX76_009671 [Chlamydomonas incerta]|eukprot:KAG2431141.1 hypothetical protein HXX76_009671 [Chlamydomonas incerta]
MLSNSAPSPPNLCNSAPYRRIQSCNQPLQPCLGRTGLGRSLGNRAIPAPKASQQHKLPGARAVAPAALPSTSNADSHQSPVSAGAGPLAWTTTKPQPGLLARLWAAICSAASTALRVLVAAFCIWLASLAPRPSLAAAATAAAPAEARVCDSTHANAATAAQAGGVGASRGSSHGEEGAAAAECYSRESVAARCLSGRGAGPSGQAAPSPSPALGGGRHRSAAYGGSSSGASGGSSSTGSSSGGARNNLVIGELALGYEPAAPGAAVHRFSTSTASTTAPAATTGSGRGAGSYGQGYSHGGSGGSGSSSTYTYGSAAGYGSLQGGLQPAAAGGVGGGSSSSSSGAVLAPGLTSSADAGTAAPAASSAAGGAAAADGGAAGASGGGGGAAAGGGSGSAAAALPPGVAAEDVALASALGLGVGEAGVVRLFERCRPSVVNISGMRAMQTFTTLDLTKVPTGQGSGFIWGDKGCVVTAYHLVKGAAEVKVTLYDNTSYTAKVLGYDAAKDVAVLKLSVPKSKLRELQPVTPGSSAGLRVGQSVYGIANPWGLGHTLSQGLVSGLGCELSGCGLLPLKGVIAANTGLGPGADPGASGGVLLDSKGAVVGMLVSPPASGGGGGGGGGRSYAVPLDAVRGLVGQILSYGRTVRPALGITMAPPQVLERVGVEGVLVLEVPPGSPAHAAGLRPTHRDIFGDLVLGDVVVGLDGKPVRSAADLYDILDEHRVGDRLKLELLRDGKATGLTVTLGERTLGGAEE